MMDSMEEIQLRQLYQNYLATNFNGRMEYPEWRKKHLMKQDKAA